MLQLMRSQRVGHDLGLNNNNNIPNSTWDIPILKWLFPFCLKFRRNWVAYIFICKMRQPYSWLATLWLRPGQIHLLRSRRQDEIKCVLSEAGGWFIKSWPDSLIPQENLKTVGLALSKEQASCMTVGESLNFWIIMYLLNQIPEYL